MKTKKCIMMMALMTFAMQSYSQDIKRELGFRGTGVRNYGLIYKFEKEPGVYRRYRAASASVSLDFRNDYAATTFGAFSAKEKRKEISEKLSFVRGWEWGLSTSLSVLNQDGVALVRPSLGYILGANYNVNKDLSIGLEVVPTVNITYYGGGLSVGGSFGTSKSFINFTIAHTFQSAAKIK